MLARSSGNLCLILGGTWIAIDRVGRTICVGDDQEWRMPDSDPVVCQALIEGATAPVIAAVAFVLVGLGLWIVIGTRK